MKIINVEVFVIDLNDVLNKGLVAQSEMRGYIREFLFVKLTTDEGIVGYGETTELPFEILTSAKLIKEVAEAVVVGKSPFDVELAFRNAYNLGYKPGRPERTFMGLWSAIDMACWDIIGKAANQPIYNLLGGMVNETIRTYSYVYANHNNPDEWCETLLKYIDMGFTAVKFDTLLNGPAPKMMLPVEFVHYEEVTRLTRETIGDKCDILIGTHGQFTTAEAVRLAKTLEQYNPLWFEEPVPPDNPEGMEIVARSTGIPIAAGERLATKYECYQLIKNNAIGILQFDMGRIGGFMEAKKVAGMAEAAGIVIAPHVYSGPLLAAASVQIDVCSTNFLIQEGIFDWGGIHAKILNEPLKWEKGYITPSNKPGLGVELNEEYVRRLCKII